MTAHLHSNRGGGDHPRPRATCRPTPAGKDKARPCTIRMACLAMVLLATCSLEQATPPGGDSRPDQCMSDLRPPDTSTDQPVVKDSTTPDQGAGGIVLVSGSFSTGGSASAGNIVLLASGFELGKTQCASGICLTGGIVP